MRSSSRGPVITNTCTINPFLNPAMQPQYDFHYCLLKDDRRGGRQIVKFCVKPGAI